MALMDRIRRWVGVTLIKAATIPIVPQWLRWSFMQPTFRALTAEGYKGNGAVFACISALAFAFPEPPALVWEETDAGKRPLRAHGLSQLLRKPNPDMGLAELLLYTIVYLAIGGNCYWYKVRSRAGRVVELWPLNDGQIRPIAGGTTLIDHYEYDVDEGVPETIAKRDIVHFKWMPDPLAPHRGLAPLVAVAREVDTDNEATRYLFSLLKNDAMPRVALKIPNDVDLDDDKRKRLKQQFGEDHGGDNRGTVALLEGGLEIERIASNLKELEFNTLRFVPEARICAAFRVPVAVAGMFVGLEKATYSNISEQITFFTERTLVFLWGIIDDKLTSDLLPEFAGKPNEIVEFDLDKVAVLAQKKTTQRQWALDALGKATITKNEFRSVWGLPRDLNGDVYLQGLAITEVPAVFEAGTAKQLAVSGQQLAKSVIAQAKAGQRRKLQEAIVAAQRQARREVAGRMESALDGYFAQLADHVIHRARKAWTPLALQKKDDLLNEDDFNELVALVKRYYIEVLQLSWGYFDTALGVEVAFDLTDPLVNQILGEAGKRVRGIDDTTRESLRMLLKYGEAQGWSVEHLVRGDPENGIPGLRDLIEQTYKNRARTIARTELGNAQNEAAVGRYESAGVTEVLVLDNGNDDDDSACKQVNGSIKPLQWAVDNPLEHPNCTRAFAPHFG